MKISLSKDLKKYSDNLSIILSTDDKLNGWLNPEGKIREVSSEVFIKDALQWQSKNSATTYAIIIEDVPIGTISLAHVNKHEKSGRIGYWIASRYWHKGYTTQAFDLILKEAKTRGLRIVSGIIPENNHASLKIWHRYNATFIKDDKNDYVATIKL